MSNEGDKIRKRPEEWKEELPPERFHVLFQEGTEPPRSSPLNHEKREGIYRCAACGNALFRSDAKYESGSGWPSFTRPVEGHVETKPDHSLGMARTEYHCARCGGHQGHVFDDGPGPEGLRFCNNGLSLEFVPEEEAGEDER